MIEALLTLTQPFLKNGCKIIGKAKTQLGIKDFSQCNKKVQIEKKESKLQSEYLHLV